MKTLSELTSRLVKTYIDENSKIESKLIINWFEIANEYKDIAFPKNIKFIKDSEKQRILTLFVKRGFTLVVQMASLKIITKVNDFLGYKYIDKIKIIPSDKFKWFYKFHIWLIPKKPIKQNVE